MKWTEQRWLACDTVAPLLAGGTRALMSRLPEPVRERRLRHALVALVNRVLTPFNDPASKQAAVLMDRFAAGEMTRRQLEDPLFELGDECPIFKTSGFPFGSISREPHFIESDLEETIEWIMHLFVPEFIVDRNFGRIKDRPEIRKEVQRLLSLLREIFGNPFRPAVIDPAWLAWNGGTVVKLARAIYDERRWENMPILGDALEDAMCHDAAILDHCRGPGPHARGCWVVDLILGKS